MVGSGFSKNATSPGSHPGFPDWSRLGDRLYESLHGNPPEPNERYLQVPALAHQVEAAFGRPALDQMLRDFIPDLQHEPSPLHEALLDLPWSDVFTTNYDTLLERARRSVISQRYDVVLKPDDLGHSDRPAESSSCMAACRPTALSSSPTRTTGDIPTNSLPS